MAKKLEKFSIVEICPVRNVVARFGNKWAFLVILVLNENGSTRFNQLCKLIPDISTKGAFRHAANAGGGRFDKPNRLSRSPHPGRIQTDGNRRVACTHHSATDGLGSAEHEIYYETPEEI